MRHLIDQLEVSLQQPLYFLSLFMALTIPDIGGALDSNDGLATGAKYATWYDRWIRPEFGKAVRALMPPQLQAYSPQLESPMTGEACYQFRCSLLHQGTTHHPKSPFSRILFVEPGASTNTFHYNILNDALNIDVRLFCLEMISGARGWLNVVANTPRYQSNHDKFVRRYPEGLAPYIVGVPVVG